MKISDLKNYTVVQPASFKQLEKEKEEKGKKGLAGFGTGVAKGLTSTTLGLGRLAGKAASGVGKLIPGEDPLERYGASVEEGYGALKPMTEAVGTAEKIGKGVEQIGEYFIPGAAGIKAAKGAGLATRIGMGAAETGVVGLAQTGDFKEGAKAAAVGGAIPLAGAALKPAARFIGRLFKGVGTGMSGMSSKQLEAILNNPKEAQKFVKQIKKAGGAELLRKEADDIVQGVSKVRQTARKAYGEGVAQLKAEDINPKLFRDTISATLNKFGSVVKNGKRQLTNVEFSDPKNLKMANELINKISKTDLDGLSLRKTLDAIDEKAYKIATTDERLSFNAFVRELAQSVKGAISGSTSKLDEINKAYSTDMQLAESIEKIFGKVKFKSAKEVLNVSQKLEGLFNQKGLAPEITDNFLKKIGIDSGSFKAGEAVRQVGEIGEKANTMGTNPWEILRSITAAIVPPNVVRDVAIKTGLAKEAVKEMAEKLSPAVRGIVFKALLTNDQPDVEND